ncbi:non-specific lipid transfer protein GPI-anchored 11-like isoform X2 [Rhododendron vialii]|uniref:non-specific lipid transfer protein GPI-anchored 11-like isoform X2 n=1 Tax=Rhododendron vialii TaxID=182163 RepID=UPI00265ED410|nr:non-specific lipid transfer protein GPI-anchored 11-like isoform X2 [Rhododendron vialii]
MAGCGAYPFCGLAAMVAAVLWGGAAAQFSSSCTSELISMSPCLNYITGNSSEPSSSCCQQLASVVKSQPQCLCATLNSGGSLMGINVNQTQALALHAARSVTTPPISLCSGSRAINVSSIRMFGGILSWALRLGINCCVLMGANIVNEWRSSVKRQLDTSLMRLRCGRDTPRGPPIVQGHKLVAIEHLAVSLEDTRGASS